MRPRGLKRRSTVFTAELERVLAGTAALLFRTLPDHAGKALERHQRLAGIGPFLQLFDGDVIERLPSGAAREQRAGNVDHVRRAAALVQQRRAAGGAEAARSAGRLVFITSDRGLALDDAEALAPAA